MQFVTRLLRRKQEKRQSCGDEYDSDEDNMFGDGFEEPAWRQLEHLSQFQDYRRTKVKTDALLEMLKSNEASPEGAKGLLEQWRKDSKATPAFTLDHQAKCQERAKNLLSGKSGSATVSGPMRDGMFPPLVAAAKLGSLPWVSALLLAGAHVNEPRRYHEVQQKQFYDKEWDWDSDTALIAAIREGHEVVARYLLEHGADPTVSSCLFDDQYDDALGLAAGNPRLSDEFRAELRSVVVAIGEGNGCVASTPILSAASTNTSTATSNSKVEPTLVGTKAASASSTAPAIGAKKPR